MWNEGIISTDDGKQIARPGMTLAEFLASGVVVREPAVQTCPDYELAGIGPLTIDATELHADGCFHNGRLWQLTLALSEDAMRAARSVARGSPKSELQVYKEWVKRLTGKKSPARFRWGDIVAVEEPRMFFRFIIIEYKQEDA